MRRLLLVLPVLGLLLLSLGAPASANGGVTAGTAVRKTGYLTVPDGTRLKWTVLLPAATGHYPVLLQYEGYLAGSYPHRVNEAFADQALQSGYAVLGVSMRGTACSDGVWDPFLPVYAEDGRHAVEWAATQPWSTGKVGMFSFSFAGIMQLFTAEQRPKGLVAVAPGMPISDTYRDIGFPGGILNDGFPPLWDVALRESWASAAGQARAENDTTCLANIAQHEVTNEPYSLLVQGPRHQYRDAWHSERSSVEELGRIDVPVLGMSADQDEQVGPRGALSFNHTEPALTWTVATNGYHDLYRDSPRWHALLLRFFDHYLKSTDNGWTGTPHVQLWNETALTTKDPAFVLSSNRRPFPTRPLPLHLQADGTLTTAGAVGGSVSYAYPSVSPQYLTEGLLTDQATATGATWTNDPVVPGGYAAFTTPPLDHDLAITGPASLDVWMTSTAPSADVQATVTEVRPDGQEMYLERGWLRLSHRALDTNQSTRMNPVHVDTHAADQDMPRGQPALARLAIPPFTHVFRKGSRLRLWLDTPSATGLWDFAFSPTPSVLGVLTDPAHPSTLVVGSIPGATAEGHALPGCHALALLFCRLDPLSASSAGQPAGDSPGIAPSARVPHKGGGLAATGGDLLASGTVGALLLGFGWLLRARRRDA